jgi:type II secretory pathway pseudopilin PulG
MGTQKTSGFTIVESLLFLAISGVLVVTMIGGVGVTIQIQRYRDAVGTFKSLVQDQYSELTSVKNERQTTWTCTPEAVTEEGGSDPRERGQSQCVILGRFMTIEGPDITVRTVVGYQGASVTTGDDMAKLRSNYTLNVTDITVEQKKMEWGTQIAWPSAGPGANTACNEPIVYSFA